MLVLSRHAARRCMAVAPAQRAFAAGGDSSRPPTLPQAPQFVVDAQRRTEEELRRLTEHAAAKGKQTEEESDVPTVRQVSGFS